MVYQPVTSALQRERAQKSWLSSEPCGTVGTTGAGHLLRTSPTGTLGGEAVTGQPPHARDDPTGSGSGIPSL